MLTTIFEIIWLDPYITAKIITRTRTRTRTTTTTTTTTIGY